MRSHLVTRELAERAVQLALPSIQAAMRFPYVGESGFLYIVVLDPLCGPGDCERFQDAVLYEHAVGDKTKWDADYADFALAKAKVTWRTGLDSHAALSQRPHLLTEGDALVWGSIILEGIVVSVSGANPWFDEAFALSIAGFIRGLVKGQLIDEQQRGPFLGSSARVPLSR